MKRGAKLLSIFQVYLLLMSIISLSFILNISTVAASIPTFNPKTGETRLITSGTKPNEGFSIIDEDIYNKIKNLDDLEKRKKLFKSLSKKDNPGAANLPTGTGLLGGLLGYGEDVGKTLYTSNSKKGLLIKSKIAWKTKTGVF